MNKNEQDPALTPDTYPKQHGRERSSMLLGGIREVINAEINRRGPVSLKKPSLDYYDNLKDEVESLEMRRLRLGETGLWDNE